MIRTDRVCIWIFILMFTLLTTSRILTFTDELLSFTLGGLAILDCIVNGKPRRYRLMWIILGIFSFYVIYSLFFVHFNVPKAIFADFIICVKPFLPFVVFLAVRPTFTPRDRQLLRYIAIFNTIYCGIILWSQSSTLIKATLGHISYGGHYIFISSMIYLFCVRWRNGKLRNVDLSTVIGMLVIGLGCTRSKYYGMFVVAVCMLFFYRPGMFRKISFTKILAVICVFVLVLAATWEKVQLYFIEGVQGDSDDITLEHAFARPALYAGGAMILIDHIPFGSGLASFASYYSSSPTYSKIYEEYGLNTIWGLSEDYDNFITDAYYPQLAQFGFAGIILFISFWVYISMILKREIRYDSRKYKRYFLVGVLLIWFIMIEEIANTAFVQSTGMLAMMLLGLICSHAPLKKEKTETKTEIPENDNNYIEFKTI